MRRKERASLMPRVLATSYSLVQLALIREYSLSVWAEIESGSCVDDGDDDDDDVDWLSRARLCLGLKIHHHCHFICQTFCFRVLRQMSEGRGGEKKGARKVSPSEFLSEVLCRSVALSAPQSEHHSALWKWVIMLLTWFANYRNWLDCWRSIKSNAK